MRTQTSLLFSIALTLFLGSSFASAQQFEKMAKDALNTTPEDMETLFWFQEADCGKRDNDFLKRQCEVVQKTRQTKLSQTSFLVNTSSSAVSVKLDEKMLSVEVSLHACVACESEGILIVGKGAHKTGPSGITASVVAKEKRTFKKLEEAKHWAKYVASRFQGQLIVGIPKTSDRFQLSGREGHKVKVSAFRLYDPCQGEIIAAQPSSGQGPVTAESCNTEPAKEIGTKKVHEPIVELPKRLSPQQIKRTMTAATQQLKKCHKAYKIDGKLVFKLIIAADGKLTKADQDGDFVGTPTGICIDKAMSLVRFPKSEKAATKVSYPITLR